MRENISPVDYALFVLIFIVSLKIGLYYFLKPKVLRYLKSKKSMVIENLEEAIELNKNEADAEQARQQSLCSNSANTNQKAKTLKYLASASSMNVLPLTLSLFATMFSSTALIGHPAEIYQYGVQFWIGVFGIMMSPLVGAFITGPIFHRLGLLSVFEYLDLRFGSKQLKFISTMLYLAKSFIYLAIYLIAPSACLSELVNISMHTTIVLVGAVATFYTLIGGIRSVVMSDALQAVVTFVGIFAVIIKGTYNVGGLGNVLRINEENGRLNLLDLNPDPFRRQSFWSLVFGMALFFSIPYGIDQLSIQRFTAAKSLRSAQLVFLINVPILLLLFTLSSLMGLVLYSNYHDCDPMSAPHLTGVNNPNLLMPYFVIDKLNLPGIPGIFSASVIASSLSSVSSVLNSLSIIIWKDYLSSFSCIDSMSDSKSLLLTKIIVLGCGMASVGLAFFLISFGSNLHELSVSLVSAFSGPICGVFILGCFFKFTNKHGALAATFVSSTIGIWISFGSYYNKVHHPKLKMSAVCYQSGANITNTYSNLTWHEHINTQSRETIPYWTHIYSLSYLWYIWIIVAMSLIVGLLVSCLTGGCKQNKPDSSLLFTFRHQFDAKVEQPVKKIDQ
jgi:SSS family transporter